MNIQLSGLIKTCSIACVIALTFGACSDTWDEHYKVDYSKTTATLWDQLSSKPSLSDFKEVLDSVHVSNGYRRTEVRYSQLLQQQFYTVFAPVNGTFNKDSLLSLCSTVEGNKKVEQRFIMVHLSRNPYSLSSYVDTTNVGKKALMVNGKYLPFVNGTLANIPLIDSLSNISARNGLLNGVSGQIPYRKNIYEEIIDNPEFQRIGHVNQDSIGMGGFLFKYQKDSLDALASIEAGTDDLGNTVYVDSVMIRVNSLVNSFGYINSEDSTYWMVAPSRAAWNNAYSAVSSYFKYPNNLPGADSLKRYWTNYMLMRDMFYNKNIQRSVNDSLVSVAYTYRSPLMHVYQNPYAAGGILSNVTEEISTSNGKIFVTNNWPFDVKKVFFEPIITEVEKETTVKTLNPLLTASNFRQASTVPNVGGKISSNGLIELTPNLSTNRTDVTLNVPGTLSGKYDVCVVLCPNIMSWTNIASMNKIFRFQAFLNYKTASGGDVQVSCRGGEGSPSQSYFSSNATKLDTITLTTVTFPSANYKQNTPTVSLRLWSMQIKATEGASYTHTVNLDCIYLKPRD